MNIASIGSMIFDLLPAASTGTAVANNVYTTPLELRLKVGQVSRLNYLEAVLVGSILLSTSNTGTFRVRLTDGVTDYLSESITISAGTRANFRYSGINLKEMNAGTDLYIAVDVTSATAAATFQIASQLRVQFPLVIAE